MKNAISTNKVKDLNGKEIIHYFALWLHNWTQEDFQKAFENSHLGWDYFWNKLQARSGNHNEEPDNPTNALVGIVLNMDDKHQQMLFDYIFDSKYSDNILQQRNNNAWMEEELDKTRKDNE